MGIMTKEYHNGYQQGYKDAKEEFKNAMHKYQKIKEIVNGWNRYRKAYQVAREIASICKRLVRW